MNLQTGRPIINIPMTPFEMVLEAICIIGIIYAIYMLVSYWSKIPETVAIHFTLSGEPDQWGSKKWLFIMPIMAISVYIFITVVDRISPSINYPWPLTPENAHRQYFIARTLTAIMKAEIIWLFVYIQRLGIIGALENKLKCTWKIVITVLVVPITIIASLFMSYLAR